MLGAAATCAGSELRIMGGTLRAGSPVRATSVYVDTDATLAGEATVVADTVITGTIAPGMASIGDVRTLSFSGAVRFESGSRYECCAASDIVLDRILAVGRISGTCEVLMSRDPGAAPVQQPILEGAPSSDYSLFVLGGAEASDWTMEPDAGGNLLVSLGAAGEGLVIPADGTTVYSAGSLHSASPYHVRVTGTYRYDRGERGEFADAQYREDDNDVWSVRYNSVEFDGVRLDADVFDGPIPNHTYVYRVQGKGAPLALRIHDDPRGYDDNEGNLFAEIVPNGPPVAHAGGQYVFDEGRDIVLDGSGSHDPNEGFGDIPVCAWDLDGRRQFDDATGEKPTVTYAKLHALGLGDDGAYPVTLRVTDNFGEEDTATEYLTINNVAPLVDAGTDRSVRAGETVVFSGSFTDPGVADMHTAWIEWGTGRLRAAPWTSRKVSGPSADRTST